MEDPDICCIPNLFVDEMIACFNGHMANTASNLERLGNGLSASAQEAIDVVINLISYRPYGGIGKAEVLAELGFAGILVS